MQLTRRSIWDRERRARPAGALIISKRVAPFSVEWKARCGQRVGESY
jgi:hypothetical protein